MCLIWALHSIYIIMRHFRYRINVEFNGGCPSTGVHAAAVTVLFSRPIEDLGPSFDAAQYLAYFISIFEHFKKTRSLCSNVLVSPYPNINLRLQSFRDFKRMHRELFRLVGLVVKFAKRALLLQPR